MSNVLSTSQSDWIEKAARAGYLTKGVLYLTLGGLSVMARAIASKCLGMYAQDSEQVAVVPACKKALIIDAEFPVLLEAALDSFE